MAPTPQEHVTKDDMIAVAQHEHLVAGGEEIVISGMSGMYPQSHNVKELSDILYNKKDPVSSEGLRWDSKYPDLGQYAGMVPDLDVFDAQFFAVNYWLANYMDPMARKMLENSYQAIYDAGVNPASLSGKKVAVIVGSAFADSERNGYCNPKNNAGLNLLGVSKTMYANRISYWLNAKGPSLSLDDADMSSSSALEQAYVAMKRGGCEAAIVAGAHLCLYPQGSIHNARMNKLSKDGKTKAYSEDADGYVVSDAISVLFLQKAKDALRVYGEIVHVKNEFISLLSDSTGPKFGFQRDPLQAAKFIRQFYKEAHVSPQEVEYVEGYGTALPDNDKTELEAIEDVYCNDREKPLLVGSVSSNIGVTNAASSVTAITKVLLGYHTGKLAANLHCTQPRQDIRAIQDGRMRVVTEHFPFNRSYVAVNGMSLTGINSHVLLHGHYKPKNLDMYKCTIPRLVVLSGRHESSVNNVIEDLTSRPIDAEELALLHNIHSSNMSGHLGRGFVILDTDNNDETVSLQKKVTYYDVARRPLWFVYSGMGSQWVGMGTHLMKIPIFAAAIERCHQVLKPKGIDLVRIITSSDKTTFDNILHSFVGIAAIQIGLTDVLRELDIVPDGIIGHSVGELGCAYADGCLTAEEMILAAYCRGLVSLQTPLIRGSMAAVGLGYKEVSQMCPPEIDVACHNGPDSSTISGPAEAMKKFVAELTGKGIFAREVPCSNIAYHSRYIADAGPNLLKHLKEVIKTPKPRSSRWLSSSIPQDRWNEELAQYSSAEYHTNNLLNPVLFEETSRLVPLNVVTVEVAPHSLLQAILKRSMSTCQHIPLTRRGAADNTFVFLQAIGNLYMEGFTPKVQALYPKVEFPVSTGTPMLSHLVEWSHGEKLLVVENVEEKRRTAAARQVVVSIHDDEHSYLRGHVVREKLCYPFAAILVDVWDTVAMHMEVPKRLLSVHFKDVHLFSQPMLHEQKPLKLNIALQRGIGRFEVMNGISKVAIGYIFVGASTVHQNNLQYSYDENEDIKLGAQDVYQLLHDRDYTYSGEFQSIVRTSTNLNSGALQWKDNWVTLIDGILQLNALKQLHTGFSQPIHIGKLTINVKQHANDGTFDLNGKTVMNVHTDNLLNTTRCGGVSIENIKFVNLLPINQEYNRFKSEVATNNTCDKNNKTGVTLQIGQIGDLDSLQWVETSDAGKSDDTVDVHYAGLNILDVKRATGDISCDSNGCGMDYSGTMKNNERVMGIVPHGSVSSHVKPVPELLWPVPPHWSLVDAATVPLPYTHALYCLVIKARLRSGMKVLVHGGAGALGQAAISVALAYKCQVFTTVSNIQKKIFIKKLFPDLQDECIGNSRDGSFQDMIRHATKGLGCHIIINCLEGKLTDETIKCASLLGVIIDTNQIKSRDNYYFGMSNLDNDRTYTMADFSSIFSQDLREERKVLQALLCEGIVKGFVRPLSRVTYAPRDMTRAFRLLAGSRHRGRVLLSMREAASTCQRVVCSSEKCHLIFWDESVFGVQLVERLISRGAKKLYIHCTEATPYQLCKIESWRKSGCEVVLSKKRAIKNETINIAKEALKYGEIEGIYFIAVANVTDKTKLEEYELLLQDMDLVSRILCPGLKYFAVASTRSTFGHEVCQSRKQSGCTATEIDLSSILKDEGLCWRKAVDVAELALCGLRAEWVTPVRSQPPPLLHELAAIADLRIPNNASVETTLNDLGMFDKKVSAIASYLNANYNLCLRRDQLTKLTIKQINEIEEAVIDSKPENVKGFATFFSSIGSDELLATNDMVVLPTLVNDSGLSDMEYDINKKHLYIVPGLEGHHEKFHLLCERLKIPALVLQPGLDRPYETVRETAERYAQILKNKTNIQDNFYILGYESGVLVALEFAAILEDQGYTGTVFCIGHDPQEFHKVLEEHFSEYTTEEQLGDAIIRHVHALLTGEQPGSVELETLLQSATSWKQKIQVCTRRLAGRVAHSAQYARAALHAARGRLRQARAPAPPAPSPAPPRALRSRLVLLRAACALAPGEALQAHSQQPVVRYQLRTPLSHIAKDMQCAAIINRHLDADIQKEFERKNLCETYISTV